MSNSRTGTSNSRTNPASRHAYRWIGLWVRWNTEPGRYGRRERWTLSRSANLEMERSDSKHNNTRAKRYSKTCHESNRHRIEHRGHKELALTCAKPSSGSHCKLLCFFQPTNDVGATPTYGYEWAPISGGMASICRKSLCRRSLATLSTWKPSGLRESAALRSG